MDSYTCSKTRLTENVFPLSPAVTVTLTLQSAIMFSAQRNYVIFRNNVAIRKKIAAIKWLRHSRRENPIIKNNDNTKFMRMHILLANGPYVHEKVAVTAV